MVQVLRKFFLLGMSIFMFKPILDLLRYLVHVSSNQVGFGQAFFLAFSLSLCATGIFAFAGFAFATHKLLSPRYYQIQNPDRLKRVYAFMQVKHFRILLLVFFWGWKRNRKKYFNGRKDGLNQFVYETKQSEFGHLGGLILTFIVSIPVLLNGHYAVFVFIQLLNLLGNFYPIILQRYHRMRVSFLQ